MIIYDYRVGDFMTKKVRAVTEDMTLDKVSKIMTKFRIGSVVVMKKEHPVGIITDTDIVRKVMSKNKNPKKTKTKDVMTRNVITVSPETSIREAAYIMTRNNVRRLPVIDKKEGLVGIVTETDVIRILSNVDRIENRI